MNLDQYAVKYQSIKMNRSQGVLEITLHTRGGPLQWGSESHRELAEAFANISDDQENKVVVITGTGEWFTGPKTMSATGPPRLPAGRWVTNILWHGHHLQMNLLEIQVPIICAMNGPAWRHAELPLLCDIVLGSEDVVFQDAAHLVSGMVPGDGGHIVYPLLLGMNRARYFLLTGQTIDAHQAQALGLVNEVLPRERLLPRAHELAQQLSQQSLLVLRNTRALLTQPIKKYVLEQMTYGLALQGFPPADQWSHNQPGEHDR